MLLRPSRRFTSLVAAVMACVAMLVYASTPPAAHAPGLHAAEYAMADEFHDHDHGHSHDWDIEKSVGDPDTDHHHADHSHEKASLFPVLGIWRIGDPSDTRLAIHGPLVGGPPFVIQRPPRSMA